MLKHSSKFILVTSFGAVFMFLGRIAISSLVAFFCFMIIDNYPGYQKEIPNPALPVFLIWVMAMVISGVYLSTFTISANTILQCFLVDYDLALQEGIEGAKHRPPALEGFLYLIDKQGSVTPGVTESKTEDANRSNQE